MFSVIYVHDGRVNIHQLAFRHIYPYVLLVFLAATKTAAFSQAGRALRYQLSKRSTSQTISSSTSVTSINRPVQPPSCLAAILDNI